MNIFLLAWKRLIYKPLQNSLAVTVMAFSIALALLGLLLSAGLHKAIVTAVEPFPLVLGVKGSPNQLLLNTIFLKDVPIGNFSYQVVEQLRRDDKVKAAYPLGFGDSYQGHRLVGTEAELFAYRLKPSASEPWLHLTSGRLFAGENEVVLGAAAARSTKLQLGDSFTTIHGVINHPGAAKHKAQFKVVGILAPVNGPYDDAIFTSLTSIWQLHKHTQTPPTGLPDKTAASKSTAASSLMAKAPVPTSTAASTTAATVATPLAAETKNGGVTAVLLLPAGYAQALKLNMTYSRNRELQLLFPAKQVIELFDLAGSGEKLLSLICLCIIILSLLIISCNLYWLIQGNRRQQAILQSMGASSQLLLQLNFCSGLLLCLGGILLGTGSAHLLYALISRIINQQTALVLTSGFVPAEAALLGGILLCSAGCCFLQAWLTQKQDILPALQE
jgi:putative ABC transport system permease protein